MADAFIGEIRHFGGGCAPSGWALCNGQLLDIKGNESLYSLIGTSFGGDGKINFALPDLQGRVALGYGQGTGLSDYPLGAKGGSYVVSLTSENMYPHTHTLSASTAIASAPSPVNTVFAALPTGYVGYVESATTGLTTGVLNANAVSQISSQPHANTMPSLTLSFIICLNGIYPSFGNS